MNVNQLRTALSHYDADPGVVMDQLKMKRQRRHRRQGIIGGLAMVMIVATGAGIWSQAGPSPTDSHSALTPGESNDPSSYEAPPGTGFHACLSPQERFSDPLALGASVITGVGTVSGKTRLDGYRYHEVVLTDVKTLAGPSVVNESKVWVMVVPQVKSGAAEKGFGVPNAPLWGPGNRFFGLYLPQKVNQGPLGTVLQQLPLVNDQVIFKPAGCWNSFSIGNLTGGPYQGPLIEIPGSGAYAGLAPEGFVAVPLTTIEGVLPG
jgi:hypothetical protein